VFGVSATAERLKGAGSYWGEIARVERNAEQKTAPNTISFKVELSFEDEI